MFLLYLVLVGLLLLSVKKGTGANILILFSLIFVSVLWAGNYDGPDIANYFIQYDSVKSITDGDREYGLIYSWILKFFSTRSYSFGLFRLIVSFCGLSLLFLSIKKWANNIHICVLAYFLTIIFMDGIQMRNFMALPFLYMGFAALFSSYKYRRIIYLCTIMAASMIHSAFLGYILFLCVPFDGIDRDKVKRIVIIAALSLSLLLYIGRSYLDFLVFMVSSVDQERAISYTENTTTYGPFIPLFLQIMAVLMTIYFYRQSLIITNNGGGKDKKSMILDLISWINVLALLLVSFSFVQLTFYRLVRNLILLNVASYTLLDKKTIKASYFIILYIVAWALTDYFIMGDIDTLIRPFFDKFQLSL